MPGRESTSVGVGQEASGYDQLFDGATGEPYGPKHHWSSRHLNVGHRADENHPEWKSINSLAPGSAPRNVDIGGLLDIAKVEYNLPSYGSIIRTGGYADFHYDGPLVASLGSEQNIPDYQVEPMTRSQIVTSIPWGLNVDSTDVRWALGGTAISRCRPAQPQADLAVSVGELLREGFPSLMRKLDFSNRTETFRSLGSNYLNSEFGWKPFVNDIRKTSIAILNQDKILNDLVQNSGKRIRRRYSFAPVEMGPETYDAAYRQPWPYLGYGFMRQEGCYHVYTGSKKTWFSGEFMYRVPDDLNKPSRELAAKARHLLGVQLTPSVLWNLAPWTWLGDWVGNVGPVLATIDSITQDDLVMRYGYLMQEVVVRKDVTHHGLTYYGQHDMPSVIKGSMTWSLKTRVPASPYGFGLTNSDFSPRQLAVLGALGMTRLPR